MALSSITFYSRGINMPDDGWSDYQRLVIHRLESIERRLDHLDTRLNRLDVHVARVSTTAKVTAGFIGGIAGLIPAIITMVRQ